MHKILGIDYGRRKTGIAIAEKGHVIAVPYEIIESDSEDFVIERIRKICREEGVRGVVLGVPFHKNRKTQKQKNTKTGEVLARGEQMKVVLDFSEKLEAALLGVAEVYLEDERFTTREANRLLREGGAKKKRGKGGDDDISAMLILQTFLERRRN